MLFLGQLRFKASLLSDKYSVAVACNFMVLLLIIVSSFRTFIGGFIVDDVIEVPLESADEAFDEEVLN